MRQQRISLMGVFMATAFLLFAMVTAPPDSGPWAHRSVDMTVFSYNASHIDKMWSIVLPAEEAISNTANAIADRCTPLLKPAWALLAASVAALVVFNLRTLVRPRRYHWQRMGGAAGVPG